MRRKFIVAIILLLGIVGALAGVKALQIGAMIRAGAEFTVPPETVSSTPVRRDTWGSSLSAVGSITAVQGVTLQAEVPGTVTKIAFESGGTAREGQLLVQLDTSSEEAQLRAAEAQAELARTNLERAKDLRAQNLISQSELDGAVAAALQTVGQADNIRAAIAKKTIRAPFSGRLGIRTVNLGQFVDAGTPIVALHSLDPVYVDFTLPEQHLGKLRPGMPVRVASDAEPGRVFEGRLTALNPQVDQATRSVRLQATLPNRDDALRPGMFARVDLLLPEQRQALVVPVTAVLNAPYGDSVFVVTEGKDEKSGQPLMQAQMITVRLGETRGDYVEVVRGLDEGQQVVTSGVFKLRNGAPVVVDNRLAPETSADPRPADS